MPRNKTEKPWAFTNGPQGGGTITISTAPTPIGWIGNSCPAKVQLTPDGAKGFSLTTGEHSPLYLNDVKQYCSPHRDDLEREVRSRICVDCGSVYWELGLNDF